MTFPHNAQPVRRISADAATHGFLACIDAPVVVTGLAAVVPFASLDEIAAGLAGRTLQCIEAATQERADVDATAVLRGIAAGERNYNIVDSTLHGSPLEPRIVLPPFLTDNWLAVGWPGAAIDERMRRYALTLVATAANSFTPLQIDSHGFAGWMLLAHGTKHWWIYPPVARSALPNGGGAVDPRTMPVEGPCQFTTLQGGEFLFVPAGWAHAVETPVLSFGIGGSLVHAATARDAAASWQADVDQGWPATFDLPGLMAHRRGSAAGEEARRIDAGLALLRVGT